jgi:hypothetical protein
MFVSNPHQSAERYLRSDGRDFFAVYRRAGDAVTVSFQ